MNNEMKHKTIKTLAIIIAFLVLLFIYWNQNRKIKRYQDLSQIQAVKLATLNDSVATYRQENGELNFKIAALEVDKRNLKDALETAGYDIKDLKEKEIRWRRINYALKAKLEAAGSGTADLTDTVIVNKVTRDTVYLSTFEWTNKYLSLQGNVFPDRVDFDYQYRTDLDILQETKRGKTIVTVYLKDPNATITSGNQITVSQKKRWYQKNWVWGTAGLVAGFAIAN